MEELSKAEDIGFNLTHSINPEELWFELDDVPAEYWNDAEIRKRGLMTWNVPPERLIDEAKKGNRLNIDIDEFQNGIGVFLNRDLRPAGTERVLLKTLIGSEVSWYLERIFSTCETAFLRLTRPVGTRPSRMLSGTCLHSVVWGTTLEHPPPETSGIRLPGLGSRVRLRLFSN